MKNMNVNLDLSNIWKNRVNINQIEEHYNCKFVCETPIKDNRGSWRDTSSLIFYSEVPHPQGSNYMALSISYHYNESKDHMEDTLVVSNGISATQNNIVGVIDGDEVIYSRYRHDYRSGKTNVFVDGGRDYIRTSSNCVVELKINEGNLEVIESSLISIKK